MRYYLDSSAMAKVLLDEPESANLSAYLAEIDTPGNDLGISILGVVEVRRVLLRARVPGRDITELMEGVAAHPLNRAIAMAASTYANSLRDDAGNTKILRSSDAVHIATAVIEEFDVMVAYDMRLADYARQLGIAVISP